jgi:hypothetical protein
MKINCRAKGNFVTPRKNIECALCGGLAMAVYAFSRATLGIDI